VQSVSFQPEWLQLYRLFFGIYGIIIIGLIVKDRGVLPLASYTLLSWNLTTVHLLSSFFCNSMGIGILRLVSDATRFPALVGCSITVTIWWFILAPLIHTKLDESKREGFWKFNRSFRLLNIHGLNLPMIGLEFIFTLKKLHFYDLWVGLLVGFAYIVFYLVVLDRNGYHFYIILSPRTVGCILSYSLVLGLYYVCYELWNGLLMKVAGVENK